MFVRRFLRSTLLLAGLSWIPIAAGHTVELTDGTRIETESVQYRDAVLVLDGGREVPRDQVRKVIFSQGVLGASSTDELSRGADVGELLEQADRMRAEYPDVGAAVLIDDGEFTLRPDGTQLQRSHMALLVLKEPWKAAAQISQYYEEGRSRARLLLARAIGPDGTIHEFDPGELREVKPSSGMEFFSRNKTLSGQVPQVEIGSIIETIWEVETYNPYDPELFYPRWYFGSTEPVAMSRLTISVPEERELYYETGNFVDSAAAEPRQWTEGEYDTRVYQWELRDIAPVIREPGMPPVGQVVPSVVASLHSTWDYLFDFLGRFQREHVQVTPEIEAQVHEIVGDLTEPEEQLAAIYYWLQREVRYISIKGSLGSGLSGHPAALTLKNKYGDCIDKAILFATMLKVVGIKSEPIIVATNDLPADDRSLPTLYGNHAFNEVELNGRTFHLDCTGTAWRYPSYPLNDHGVSTINVLERKIGHTETPPPEENELLIDLNMRLEADGTLKVILKLEPNGNFEAIGRMMLDQVNSMLRRTVAQQAINALCPGAELKKLEVGDESDLTTQLTATLKIVLPEYPTFAGDLMIFEMPLARAMKSLAAIAALDQRDYDIQSPTVFSLRQHIQLDLPAGYVPRGLPEPVELSTPFADYSANYEYADGKVVFNDNLELTHRVIESREYPELKQFVENCTDFIKHPLLLTKTGSES